MTGPQSATPPPLPIDVLVAADIGPIATALIAGDQRFRMTVKPAYEPESLRDAIGSHKVVVTRYQNRVTAEALSSASNLELIVQGTSGLDNIDQKAARARQIEVIGLPGENANAVAELVFGIAITQTRTIRRYDAEVRRGVWERGDCASRRELRGYRLGVIGLGRVGTAIARLAAAFSMPVTAFDPYLSDEDFRKRGAIRAGSLAELLASTDIVTFHVPLTSETAGMMGAPEIAFLPEGSFLINASRGAVVDIDAALAALERGHLAGLALDVFEPEPPSRAWPEHDGLILTPHIAGCSRESKESIGRLIYLRICEHFGLAPIAGDTQR